MQTITIAQRELGILGKIPYYQDKRIREWCFGSFEGMYDADLFSGVLPRISGIVDATTMSFEEIANGIVQADTANWAESWEVLSGRILDGFSSIARKIERQGGGNALVVSHGMTIATLVDLLAPEDQKRLVLDNGSITVIKYADGKMTVESVGDMSYRQRGAEIIAEMK